MSGLAIRAASVLFVFFGLGGGVGHLAVTIFVLLNDRLPVTPGGIRAGSGPFEHISLDLFVAMGFVFVAVSALEVVAGLWLWRYRRRGALLGMLLWLMGLPLWVGFALPAWLIAGPLRLVLLAVGWRTLR